jgi:hypothetical protein
LKGNILGAEYEKYVIPKTQSAWITERCKRNKEEHLDMRSLLIRIFEG